MSSETRRYTPPVRTTSERLDYGLVMSRGVSESAASAAANTVRRHVRNNAVLLQEIGLFPRETVIKNGQTTQVEMIRIEMVGVFISPNGDILTFSRPPKNPEYPHLDESKPVGDLEILNGVGNMCITALTEIRKRNQRKKLATMLKRLEDKTIHAGGLEDPISRKTVRRVLGLKSKQKSK